MRKSRGETTDSKGYTIKSRGETGKAERQGKDMKNKESKEEEPRKKEKKIGWGVGNSKERIRKVDKKKKQEQ